MLMSIEFLAMLDTIVWGGLLALFLIVEAVCAIHLVSIWFAVGAAIALAASLLGAPIWLQITLFLLVSCVLLALLLPFVRKVIKPKLTATNIDSVIGSTGYVTIAIDNAAAQGQVKLDAMFWTARSHSGEPIAEGTLVRVLRIEGVKVFVSPAEVPAAV